jgi:hypothetical protein
MPRSDIDREIDKLYQLPLDEFTAARNALAKQGGGAAGDVKSLQKPPVAAWAVNQLYWERRAAYDALVEAAETLRAAHKAVLSGKGADLRAAGKEHEEALEAALKAALALLQESGNPATDATKQAIATTLRGLPADEPPGRLSRVLQPGGFEMLAGIPVREAPPSKGRAAGREKAASAARPERDTEKSTAAESKALARAREAVTTATRELKLAEHAAKREEFEAARAAREVEKCTRAVEAAQADLESAQRALDEAEREAEAASRKREAGERRARETDTALSRAHARLADAEKTVAELSRSGKR